MKISSVNWLLLLVSLVATLRAGEPAATAPASVALRQIVLTEKLEIPENEERRPGGYVVASPALATFDLAELTKRLSAGENQPVTEQLLAGIARVVEVYARQNDFPAAQVIIPPQDISNGVVRVAVLLGRIRDIKISGNQWFSESLLRRKLQIERGETVRFSELDQSIAWTNNTSPFRRVHISLQPVPQTGEVDLAISVEDRLPLKLQASYDNTGPEVIGQHRVIAGLTYANLWGRDHQATYQYLTSDEYDIFTAHAIEYRVPLPWRHMLQFSASYSRATPTLFEGFITQVGESVSADLRYSLPWKFGSWRSELSATLNFKTFNNNLFLLGEPVPFETTDVFAATMSGVGVREDKRGQWLLSASLTGSPGDVNSRNTRQAYFDSRIGSNPRFVHGQVAVQRLTRVTPKLTSTTRAIAQLASANLLGSEQFSIGGFNSVRGYSDRALSGDGGYTFTQELQHLGPKFRLSKRLPELTTAGVVFADYGRVLVKFPVGNQLHSADIAGAGLGLRFSAGDHFSAWLDYGWALVDMVNEDRKLHAKVTLSF